MKPCTPASTLHSPNQQEAVFLLYLLKKPQVVLNVCSFIFIPLLVFCDCAGALHAQSDIYELDCQCISKRWVYC